MDLRAHFKRLLKGDVWGNQEVVASLRGLKDAPGGTTRLLAHILAAEHVWLARLTRAPQPFAVWPEFTVAQAEEQVQVLARLWDDYFAEHVPAAFGQTVTYKNSKGETWNSTVEDILTHVFLHSAYHRGQIAMTMRQAGLTPAYTDFIHAVRQGWVE